MRRRAQFVGFLGKVAAADDVKIHRAKVIDLGDGAAAQLELTGIADATGAGADTRFRHLHAVDGDTNHLRQRLPEEHHGARRTHLLRRSEASVIGRGQRE